MASYKVEICGVNTATLPLLNAKEKSGEFLKKFFGIGAEICLGFYVIVSKE